MAMSVEQFRELMTEKYLRRAVELDNSAGAAKAYFNLGLAYQRLKHYEDSEEAYRNALALRPNYPEAWYNLALLELQNKNYDKAEEHGKPELYGEED